MNPPLILSTSSNSPQAREKSLAKRRYEMASTSAGTALSMRTAEPARENLKKIAVNPLIGFPPGVDYHSQLPERQAGCSAGCEASSSATRNPAIMITASPDNSRTWLIRADRTWMPISDSA